MLSLYTATDIQAELASAIKQARNTKGWSVAYLSELSGVPNSTIRKFENTGNISLRQFLMLCEALDKLEAVLTMAQSSDEAMPTSIDAVLKA